MEVPGDFHGSYDPKLGVTRAKSRSNASREFALTVIDGLRLIGTTGKTTYEIRLFLFFLHSMETTSVSMNSSPFLNRWVDAAVIARRSDGEMDVGWPHMANLVDDMRRGSSG
jgi:hypothetical protein